MLVTAGALVDAQGRVLIAQRPEGKAMAGLWEFPGGKVEPGETPEAALVRELAEELDVQVEQSALTPFAFASHAYESFHLLMPLYLVAAWAGAPKSREKQALAWVHPRDMHAFPMPPADVPLVQRLMERAR